MKSKWKGLMFVGMIITLFIVGHSGTAAACKVLSVVSYHESFIRWKNIQTGIEEILGEQCELTYLYLDGLAHPENIEEKAKEAYAQYQMLQPDGVITVGEEAQKFFVVPYLSEKEDTPAMFNNIFFPEIYDFPTSNVSGIMLRWPIADSITFIQQLDPSVKTVCALFADEPSGHAVIRQMLEEQELYSATLLKPAVAKTATEAVEQTQKMSTQCDALYIGPMGLLTTLPDTKHSNHKSLLSAIKQGFGKATFTNLAIYIKNGVLAGVKDFGEEQGRVSAEMLLKAMQGTPVSDLPVATNQYASRLLNVEALKALGIRPSRSALAGVELIRPAN